MNMVAVDPLNQNWNLIRLPVIIVIVWSFIGFISCFPISPLMFMFFCYQSHTVCLHLLVLFCNNNPSYLCSSSVLLFFIIFWCCCLLFIYFFVLYFLQKKKKICWLAQLYVWCCMPNCCISFVCFCACCYKILEIQNRNGHLTCNCKSGYNLMCWHCLWNF